MDVTLDPRPRITTFRNQGRLDGRCVTVQLRDPSGFYFVAPTPTEAKQLASQLNTLARQARRKAKSR